MVRAMSVSRLGEVESAGRAPAGSWVAPAAQAEGLPRYLEMVRRGKWVALAVLLACVGAAAAYLVQAEKVYEAEADMLVTPFPRDTPALVPGLIRESSDPTRDVETAARLLESPVVARRVKERLRLPGSPRAVLQQVDADPVAQSNVVTITARASTPALAQQLANGFGEEAVAERTQRLHETLDGVIERLEAVARAESTPQQSQATGGRSVAEQLQFLRGLREGPDPIMRLEVPAERPSSPVRPRPALTIASALVGGVIIAIIAALLSQVLDTRVRSEQQLRERFRLPVLARIPIERAGRRRDKPLLPQEVSVAAHDAYQTLRAALSAGQRDGIESRVLLVTGPSPGDGKTTAAINLASTLSAAGKRVILVEADSRRPSVGRALGVSPERGLASVVAGRTYLVDALVPVGDEDSKLRVLLNAEHEAPVADMLSHLSADTLLLQAQRLADWVVVDSPPLNHVAETMAIARMVDDVLLVVRINRSNLRDLDELAELLDQQGIVPTGFVVVGGQARSAYY